MLPVLWGVLMGFGHSSRGVKDGDLVGFCRVPMGIYKRRTSARAAMFIMDLEVFGRLGNVTGVRESIYFEDQDNQRGYDYD